MSNKFKSYDECNTHREYYAQFTTAKPELGKRYINNKGCFTQTEYQIVYVGHGVALGVEIGKNGKDKFGLGSPNKDLFIAEGIKAGWRLYDNRPGYRLREKD